MESPLTVLLVINVKPLGGQAGNEQVYRVTFSCTRGWSRDRSEEVSLFLLAVYIFSVWSWFPFPDMLIIFGAPGAHRLQESVSAQLVPPCTAARASWACPVVNKTPRGQCEYTGPSSRMRAVWSFGRVRRCWRPAWCVRKAKFILFLIISNIKKGLGILLEYGII